MHTLTVSVKGYPAYKIEEGSKAKCRKALRHAIAIAEANNWTATVTTEAVTIDVLGDENVYVIEKVAE